jgi:hypothetical protein
MVKLEGITINIRKQIVLLLFISLLILNGCSNSHTLSPTLQPQGYTIETGAMNNSDLTNLASEAIKEEYKITPNKLLIQKVENQDGLTFASFLLTNKQNNYSMILIATKSGDEYSLVTINTQPIDYKKLVNASIVEGHNPANSRGYMVVTGWVDSKIKSISLQYPNGQFKVIKLGVNDKTYMDVTIGYQQQQSQIYGYDVDDNLVFKWK